MGLSIFWRLLLTSLVIIVVMGGVNLYALFQLRQLTAMSTEMAAYHYPAVESAKRLLGSLYAQLNSEKKYLATKDAAFLTNFNEEVEEFQRSLQHLLGQENTPQGQSFLQEVGRLLQERLVLFHDGFKAAADKAPTALPGYENRRDALMDRMSSSIQSYIDLHEARVSVGVSESRASAVKAEAVTQQLVLVALVFGLGLAGIASYTILRPLRELQGHIKEIGQGKFGQPLQIAAPAELKDLVDTVNWMGVKLQELDDMKSEFLAHVSHELRTPMASIQEGTHLLLDEIPGPLTQEQRTTLRIMADSSRRLIHLISTILDLSKMEAGMMEYRIVPVDLKRVADISVNKVRLLADSKHVQLLVENAGERAWVKVDALRIEQVLDNLLSNALKFSPEGGIVKLQMKPDQQAGVLEVSVSDTGPGIATDDLPHIFERFYQGRTKAKSAAAGSGLGLALAKKVVEAHGGRIWIESDAGKGTAVRFILRLAKQRREEGREQGREQEGTGRMTRLILQVVILSTLLGGCAAWGPTPPSKPYFSVDQTELKSFQSLIKKQDGVVEKCSEIGTCDHAYFTRALLGLYERREIAEKYFGKVIALDPKGQLAASSKVWLLLLQGHPAPASVSWLDALVGAPAIASTNSVLVKATDRLVRDLLEWEGNVQTVEYLQREIADRDHKIESLLKKDPGKGGADPALVQNFQKQLHDRDKKIEELSTQLEALKRIDQEMREKVRPIRPPSTVAPLSAPDTSP
ncbi:MAG: HAMP domain-containing protein [Nitrospira sp.]|nr:HAMP domain-containing protein [Nitrospira sp.]